MRGLLASDAEIFLQIHFESALVKLQENGWVEISENERFFIADWKVGLDCSATYKNKVKPFLSKQGSKTALKR